MYKLHTICIIHNYVLQLQHVKNSQNTDVDENSQNILNLIKDTSKATSGNCAKCNITFLYCSIVLIYVNKMRMERILRTGVYCTVSV